MVICTIDGCEKRHKARGWCAMHYRRWFVYGDPHFTLRPNYGSGRITHGKNGYVRLWMPDHPLADSAGYVYEHRFVLYESGVDITGKHVHHVNGDKADNRRGNLAVLDAGEHHSHHIGETVTNQFGTWLVKNRKGAHPHASQ